VGKRLVGKAATMRRGISLQLSVLGSIPATESRPVSGREFGKRAGREEV